MDIQEAVWAYLKYYGKDAQPWMYEMLAVALEMNGAPKSQVQSALGYAADLALNAKFPPDLTRLADTLQLYDQNDRAAALLEAAFEIDPGDPRTSIMAVNLAFKTRDPKSMARALEHLLSLGWPGQDESWRAEARKKTEELAKELQAQGSEEETNVLLNSLRVSESRDLVIQLQWAGDADLDLYVKEPLGATASALQPRTVFGGALVASGYGKHPLEVYSCPRAFSGTYEVQVKQIYASETDPPRDVQLVIITHEGLATETRSSHPINLQSPSVFPVELKDGRRSQVLPYQAPPMATQVPQESPSPRRTRPPDTPTGAADRLRPPGTDQP